MCEIDSMARWREVEGRGRERGRENEEAASKVIVGFSDVHASM